MRIEASLANLNKKVVSEQTATSYSEWLFVAGTILFLLILTTIPYIYAYLSTPEDKQYMGIMVNVTEHVQYFCWMRELTHSYLSAN